MASKIALGIHHPASREEKNSKEAHRKFLLPLLKLTVQEQESYANHNL